jgi:hypothetical protein
MDIGAKLLKRWAAPGLRKDKQAFYRNCQIKHS